MCQSPQNSTELPKAKRFCKALKPIHGSETESGPAQKHDQDQPACDLQDVGVDDSIGIGKERVVL